MTNHSEYQTLLEKYKAIDIAEKHLKALEQRIATEQKALKELDQVVDKEYQDILLLEKKSLHSIFKKVLGANKDIEKERQEYLHAVLQYNECQKLIELLQYEQKVLLETIKDKPKIEDRLKQMLRIQKADIFKAYPSKGNLFLALDEELRSLLNQSHALKIAQKVIHESQDLILKMIVLLASAKHDGSWGGQARKAKAAKQAKNKNMDHAQTLSHEVKQTLQKLEDIFLLLPTTFVKQVQQLQISKRFNDMYYTELISDWIVHSKIVASIDYLKDTGEILEKLKKQLVYEMKRCEEKAREVDQRKSKLILDL